MANDAFIMISGHAKLLELKKTVTIYKNNITETIQDADFLTFTLLPMLITKIEFILLEEA